MATPQDLAHLGAHLRPLASVIHAAATESGAWVAVVLDARFSYADQEGSFVDKVRVDRADGSQSSVSLPVEGVHRLVSLGNERPSGKDRWYGLLLRVTAEGECEVRLNYDPDCAQDSSFYES